MTDDNRKDPEREKQIAARLDLLRAQRGGGLLGIGQDAPASEARRAAEADDDWQPPPPAPMSRFSILLAFAILVLLAVLYVL